MPTKHASIKDLRKTKKRTARNLRLKSYLKRLWISARSKISGGDKAEAHASVIAFQQIADKAVKQHVISRNAAAKKKSTLMKALAKIK